MTPSTDTSTRHTVPEFPVPAKWAAESKAPCEDAYARAMKASIATSLMLANTPRRPTVKRRIAELMRDGRWRTMWDIMRALDAPEGDRTTYQNAASAMYSDGILHREYVDGVAFAYIIAGSGRIA